LFRTFRGVRLMALPEGEINSLIASLDSLRVAVTAGDVAASTATVHRLEGALVALHAVQGGDLGDLISRLQVSDPS